MLEPVLQLVNIDGPHSPEEFLQIIRANHDTRVTYRGGHPTRSKEIAEALKHNTSLTEINWELGSAGGKDLSKFIKVNKTVKKLILSNNNIGSEGGDAIAYAILRNESITYLDNVSNYLSDVGISTYGRQLANSDRLIHLKLSGSDSRLSYVPIAKALKVNRGLKYLELPGAAEEETFSTLVASLKTNRTLECLKLPSIQAGYAVNSLHDMRHSSSLKELRIHLQTISADTTAKLLGEFLTANKSLSTLGLDWTRFTKEAMPGLSEGIKNNTSIVKLSFARCGLTDDCIPPLQRALVANRTITDLNFHRNAIGREGCHRLLDVVKRNNRIRQMNISLNSIPEYISRLVEPQLKLNRAIQQENFLRQLDSEEKVPWQRCRLMVVGQGGAGKTATVRALTNKRFDAEWKSTVGISMQECKTTTRGAWAEASRGGFTMDIANRLLIQEMDKPSFLRKRSVSQRRSLLTKGAKSGLQPKESDSKVKEGEKQETTKEGITSGGSLSNPIQNEATPLNGTELGRNAGKEESGVEAAEQMTEGASRKVDLKMDDTLYVETRNHKDSVRLTVFDMGGQRVFYTVHHLFLTSNAIYLIIFSLAELQKDPDTAMSFLRYWTETIGIHAPKAPVLFVGTFLDQIEKDSLESAKRQLFDAFPTIANEESFVAISNREGTGVESLRDSIDKAILLQDFVYTPVSVRWMKALDGLLEEEKPWTTFKVFRERARRDGISSLIETEQALKLFHQFGSVMYFESTESLKDLIVHNPQWLIDQVSKVIRDARIHGLDNAELQQAGLEEDGQRLLTEGLCSRDLLGFLWQQDQVEYLISLMQSLLLMSPVRMNTTDSLMYLVPSMASEEKHISPEALEENEQCRFVFKHLPQGVFERLVCTCVSYGETLADENERGAARVPLISRHQGVIWFGDDHRVVVERAGVDAMVIDVFIQGSHNVQTTVTIVESMMLKVKTEFMNGSLEWTTQIKKPSADEAFIAYTEAKQQRMLPWFEQSTNEQGTQATWIQVDSFLNGL